MVPTQRSHPYFLASTGFALAAVMKEVVTWAYLYGDGEMTSFMGKLS